LEISSRTLKLHKTQKNPFNMQSPAEARSRKIAFALSAFESNISKNSGHTSTRDFLTIVASTPVRRPISRRLSLTTAKDIEDEYEQIIDGDFKTNPLVSPPKFHRRADGSATRPGLPSLSLLDDNDDSNTEHVVSKDEDASFCELDDDDDDDDDEESVAGSYQKPGVATGVVVKESVEDFSEVSAESYREPAAPWDNDATARVAVKEDANSVASQGTTVTEAESCESDGENCARVSILPSFEEQARMLRVRDRKPVVSVSPIKLKDRMRAFQQDMTLNAL
jgi:hypothetical protein